MLIRNARDEDADTIGELWHQLTQYHADLDDRMPTAARDGAQRYAARIRAHLRDTHTRVFVAEQDGAVIGYVLGMIIDLLPETFEPERAGFLADIYVVPEARGAGVGRALVHALRNWFQGRNLKSFEWYVATENSAGVAFWRSMGGKDVMLRMRATIDAGDSDDK